MKRREIESNRIAHRVPKNSDFLDVLTPKPRLAATGTRHEPFVASSFAGFRTSSLRHEPPARPRHETSHTPGPTPFLLLAAHPPRRPIARPSPATRPPGIRPRSKKRTRRIRPTFMEVHKIGKLSQQDSFASRTMIESSDALPG